MWKNNMENKLLILEVKKKKEFSELPDSLVKRALTLGKGDVKKSRDTLRKYFGVFLTNRVVGKIIDNRVLSFHISSKKRDYSVLYSRILDDEKSILDLGCGANGFSYSSIKEVLGDVEYLGVEASGQMVSKVNNYFISNKFNARALSFDLMDFMGVVGLLEKMKKPRTIFLFQVVDALEFFERDSSKKLLLAIKDKCEKVVLSFSLKSLSGKKTFHGDRKWILDFLNEEFNILEDFSLFDERFIILKNK